MWIKQLTIQDYRAFQDKTTIELNKNLTVIAGMNGVGKSTILAIASHAGQLTNYKLLNGKSFRGDFSDVIKYDPDHDTSGDKVEFVFEDLPADRKSYTKNLTLRATVQEDKRKQKDTPHMKKPKRYRLIPKKSKEKPNIKKVKWPSYYMGLSRLYPLGESQLKSKSSISEFQEEIINVHEKIFSEKLEDVEFSNVDIGTNHPKATMSSSEYGNNANSNGQDNLGQIIEAVFSFEKLKKEYPDYIGGILAIDELDAALHPAAQNKLINWLRKKSKELQLQIVITTHSLSMLQHICDIQKNADDITVDYLIRRGNTISVQKNSDYSVYEHALKETYTKSNDQTRKINVFTEDEVARNFIKEAMKNFGYDDSCLNFLDVNISWSHLLNLLNADYDHFSNYIFILDGDVREEIGDYIKKHEAVNFTFDKSNPNKSDVLCLPCDEPIEKMLFNYVKNLSDNDKMFDDEYMLTNGLVDKKSIERFIKDAEAECPRDSKNFYKNWYKGSARQAYMNHFLHYWFEDNRERVLAFLNSVKGKKETILHKRERLY